ncbi:hypothetical protein PSACC_03019 [Paramicrosporidium saccamoebae]|uniref:RSE1/DDB1/CPSF1 second beta-propeller domain-containing protein n=1 Tax=Paramicrosporidium saccamoebae TaxID=1246581 RepID=A0A2H9THG4_9FUNG|nr:hypothetical protein PSACC_03019 [Paramicrosporidium saccamoebae]
MILGSSPSRGILAFQFKANTIEILHRNQMPNTVLDMICASSKGFDDDCLVACGFGDSSIVGLFRENIPVCTEMRSDQIFRGCTGIWMLREYNSDKHHSILAVSFVKSTILLRLVGESLFEDITDFYGVDLRRRTLAIENTEAGSFLIQVCPDRVIICKSNVGQVAGEVLADWKRDLDTGGADLDFFSAAIINDHVFALRSGFIEIFQCRTTRGAPSVILSLQLAMPPCTSSFAVYPLGTSGPPNPQKYCFGFIVAASYNEEICLWNVYFDDGSNRVDQICTYVLEDCDFAVNEMQFFKDAYGARLALGGRDGRLIVLGVKQEEDSVSIRPLASVHAGKRPVQLSRTRLSGLSACIFALSGQASLLDETEDGVFSLTPVLHRADHLVRWSVLNSNESLFRFVVVEHESMGTFTTSLQVTPRIEAFLDVCCARFIMHRPQQGQLIVVSSPGRSEQESFISSGSWANNAPAVEVYGLNDEELLFKSVLATGDIVTCAALLGDSGFIIIGLQIQNVGQVRILKIPPNFIDRNARRRQSLPSQQLSRGGVSQLIFSCDAGFPHKVNAVSVVDVVNDGEFRVLVAAGSELHLIEVNTVAESMDFLLTECWRSDILAVSVDPESRLVAVSTCRGGLDIFSLLTNQANIELAQQWSSSSSVLIGRLLWNDGFLIGSDRRGFIHFIHAGSFKKSTVALDDIPCALSIRRKTKSLLVSTITGAIVEIGLPVPQEHVDSVN